MAYLDKCLEHAPKEQIEVRGKSLAEIEAFAIRAAFERHRGNRGRMAAELGIARSTLLRKMATLGLRHTHPRARPPAAGRSTEAVELLKSALTTEKSGVNATSADELVRSIWGKRNG